MSEEKTIQSQIEDDLIKARIAKSKISDINASTNVETLTLLKASLQNKEIAKQSESCIATITTTYQPPPPAALWPGRCQPR